MGMCSLLLSVSIVRLLHLLHDGLEGFGVVQGEVGKHLTVDLDTSLGQGTHQLRIADTLHAGSSVDTLNPQCAEIALLGATVAISVGKAFLPSILGYCPNILAGSKVATGELQNSLALCS